MTISKHDLEEMTDLLEKGSTIAYIAKKFNKKYDYWEIHKEVPENSFLGKKRSISNRLKKLEKDQSKANRTQLINEIRGILDYLYKTSKKNLKKLIDIGEIIYK
jgi:hypothetical protein